MTTLQLILLTAAATSMLTTLVLYALFRWWLLPAIDARAAAALAASRAEFARAVELSVRKGLLDGVAALPSREVLQDTTRTIARTGMELVGDSLTAWLGGARRGRRSGDRDPDPNPPANDNRP